AHTFDVPGKSARAIARLERASRQVVDGTALKERIRELAEMREKWIARTTEIFQRTAHRTVKSFLAATLGAARDAIKLCSQPPCSEDPKYRQWLQEARRKMERGRKRPQAR